MSENVNNRKQPSVNQEIWKTIKDGGSINIKPTKDGQGRVDALNQFFSENNCVFVDENGDGMTAQEANNLFDKLVEIHQQRGDNQNVDIFNTQGTYYTKKELTDLAKAAGYSIVKDDTPLNGRYITHDDGTIEVLSDDEQPTAVTTEKPVEQKPVEQKPVEQKPVEQKPVEQKPVEQKPVEQKPVEQKPETSLKDLYKWLDNGNMSVAEFREACEKFEKIYKLNEYSFKDPELSAYLTWKNNKIAEITKRDAKNKAAFEANDKAAEVRAKEASRRNLEAAVTNPEVINSAKTKLDKFAKGAFADENMAVVKARIEESKKDGSFEKNLEELRKMTPEQIAGAYGADSPEEIEGVFGLKHEEFYSLIKNMDEETLTIFMAYGESKKELKADMADKKTNSSDKAAETEAEKVRKEAVKAQKEADKAAAKAQKEAEKAQKEADKAAAKAQKEADKAVRKAEKDAAKEAELKREAAEKAQKEADKAARKAEKDAAKEAELKREAAAKAHKEAKGQQKEVEKANKKRDEFVEKNALKEAKRIINELPNDEVEGLIESARNMTQQQFEDDLGATFEDVFGITDKAAIEKFIKGFDKESLIRLIAYKQIKAKEKSQQNNDIEQTQGKGADPEPENVEPNAQNPVAVTDKKVAEPPPVINLETGEDVTNVVVDTEPNTNEGQSITVNDKVEDDAAPANNTAEPINTDEEIPEISYHESVVDSNQVIPFGVVKQDDTPESVTGAVPEPAAATADTSVTTAVEAKAKAEDEAKVKDNVDDSKTDLNVANTVSNTVAEVANTAVNSDASNDISNVAEFINGREDLKDKFYPDQQRILKNELAQETDPEKIELLKKAIAYCTSWSSRVNEPDNSGRNVTYQQKTDKDGNKYITLIKEGTIHDVVGKYGVKFVKDSINPDQYKLVPDWDNKVEE